jgi:hypothetical protein
MGSYISTDCTSIRTIHPAIIGSLEYPSIIPIDYDKFIINYNLFEYFFTKKRCSNNS